MAAKSESRRPAFQISFRIDATFATEIQRDVAMKLLNDFLQAWKVNVEEAHERNRVTIAKA
jgi:hypothetical protein